MVEEEHNFADAVSELLHNSCLQRDARTWHSSPTEWIPESGFDRHPVNGSKCRRFLVCTGSVAEFFIEPMLPCIGDIDIMYYFNNEFAIPHGRQPPSELPAGFGSRVKVLEIVDSHPSGYVFLVFNCIVSKNCDKGGYTVDYVSRSANFLNHSLYLIKENEDIIVHGPARRHYQPAGFHSVFVSDTVPCIRCLDWPTQAANWPKRQRNSEWPDLCTVDNVVKNGCDVVGVAHPSCKDDKWMRNHQWRLSFSRAEIKLLNTWTSEQQIVYHMLRIFMKTKRFTESSKKVTCDTFSNYHIKTLMLWACELTSRNWWVCEQNLVIVCVKLIRFLIEWLTTWGGQHYFIDKLHSCDYFYAPDIDTLVVMAESTTVDNLSQWFVHNYVRKCADLCPDTVSLLCCDPLCKQSVHEAVTIILGWRNHIAGKRLIEQAISHMFSAGLLSSTDSDKVGDELRINVCHSALRSCFKLSASQYRYSLDCVQTFVGHLFLWIEAINIRSPTPHGFKNWLDFLSFIPVWKCAGYQREVPRYLLSSTNFNSSVSALTKAKEMMGLTSKEYYESYTFKLAQIELALVYFGKALRCRDVDYDIIFCLANVYSAVLCYTSGRFQRAMDHCMLVTRLQDHSQCQSSFVQGELMPKIDNHIDNTSGLVALYGCIRTAVTDQEQSLGGSAFTPELFAHYLITKHLLVAKYRLAPKQMAKSIVQTIKDGICEQLSALKNRLLKCECLYISDLILCKLQTNTTQCSDENAVSVNCLSGRKVDLFEALADFSVESLMKYTQLDALHRAGTANSITDFHPLSMYSCGLYEQCVELCQRNIGLREMDIGVSRLSCTYYEFIQLMDDDIVSLIGLITLLNTAGRRQKLEATVTVSQLVLNLYILAQSQVAIFRFSEDLKTIATSMAETLNWVAETETLVPARNHWLDYLMLKLSERRAVALIADTFRRTAY